MSNIFQIITNTQFLNHCTVDIDIMTCSIEDMEQAGECNKTTYTLGRILLLSIDQLPVEDVHLIVWRTGIRKDKFHTICLHHKMVYLNKFTFCTRFARIRLDITEITNISKVNSCLLLF